MISMRNWSQKRLFEAALKRDEARKEYKKIENED